MSLNANNTLRWLAKYLRYGMDREQQTHGNKENDRKKINHKNRVIKKVVLGHSGCRNEGRNLDA
jgi:hypothetical protein